MKKVILLLLAFMLLACGKNENSKEQTSDTLTIGMELAYPPFEMTDESGNPSGISVDMAKALGEFLGKEVKIENIAWGGLIPSLKTGKLDAIISSMSITEQRSKSVDFSDPYISSDLSLLVNKDSKVQSLDDLNQKGVKIVVRKGNFAHATVQKLYPEAEILVVEKETAAALEVSQGKADAFAYDPISNVKNNFKYADTTRLIFGLGEKSPWGIAFQKGDKEFGKKINEFLRDYKSTGKFEESIDKYLAEEKKVFDEKGIDFFLIQE